METLFAFELEMYIRRSKKKVVKINATVQSEDSKVVCNIFHSLFRDSLARFELVGVWDLEQLLSLLISQTTDQLFLFVIPSNIYLPNSKLTTWRWQLAYEAYWNYPEWQYVPVNRRSRTELPEFQLWVKYVWDRISRVSAFFIFQNCSSLFISCFITF